MRKVWVLALACVLLVGMAVAPAQAGDMVPFKAKAELVSAGDLMPNPLCGDPMDGFFGTVSEFTGTGTHLGRFSLQETVCLDLSGIATSPLLPFEVFGRFVAANDDVLTYLVEGVFNVATGEVTDGGFMFTGGSGRFRAATGGGASDLIRDAEGTIVALNMKGKISYDASDRAG